MTSKSRLTPDRSKSNRLKKIQEIEERPAVVTQFYQTKLCKHFLNNNSCLYGDKCSFSHSHGELRERPNLTKTKLCPAMDDGGQCSKMSTCPYAHNLSELRATPMLYRTVLCSWWRKGQCEFGDSCRFAHGEEQLRDTSSSASLSPRLRAMASPAISSSSANGGPLQESIPVYTPTESYQCQHYPGVLGAALSAASQAAIQSGLSVLSSQQTMAIAAAASAAATEACLRILEGQTEVVDNDINQLKKGFASSPALMSFFGGDSWVSDHQETPQPSEGRARADSDPGINTERLMEQLQQLWIQDNGQVPLLRSDPFLSASHATLESYQVNND
jgi:hypothetical protein